MKITKKLTSVGLLLLIIASIASYKYSQGKLPFSKISYLSVKNQEIKNYPLFVTIPKDWFIRTVYKDYKHSSPIKIQMRGTLSSIPNLSRSGDVYFMPDGGKEIDEIRIMCNKSLGSISCYDEPSFIQYDEHDHPIGIEIREELKLLIDDTREKSGANPRVVLDGFIIEREDQVLGKVSYIENSDLNIYLLDGFVSEKNKKSRKMRLAQESKLSRD